MGERFAVKGGAGERRWGGLRVEAPPAPAAATVNSGPSRHCAVSTSQVPLLLSQHPAFLFFVRGPPAAERRRKALLSRARLHEVGGRRRRTGGWPS